MAKPRVPITKEDLQKLYYEENRSAVQVAVLFNCTSTTIKNYLRRYGMRVKDSSEVMKGRKLSVEHRKKVIRTLQQGSGESNPHWKGGSTIDVRGYRRVLVNGKYVKEHRLVMESHLGRKLTPDEEVHHISGNKLNNDISNLIILSKSDHAKLHNSSVVSRNRKSIKMQQIRADRFWSSRKVQ